MPSSTADRAPPFNLLICDDGSAGFRRLVNDKVVSLERMLTTSPKEGWVLPDHSVLAMALLCRRSGTPIIDRATELEGGLLLFVAGLGLRAI